MGVYYTQEDTEGNLGKRGNSARIQNDVGLESEPHDSDGLKG